MENSNNGAEIIYEKNAAKERVAHLWNLTKHLENIGNLAVRDLQLYYIQHCRQLGKDVELPEKCFGAAKMCPYCGSLWRSENCMIRIIQGKLPSKKMKKLMNIKTCDKRLPKCRISLIQKCIQNKKQKMHIKCLTCKKTTNIFLEKSVCKFMKNESTEEQKLPLQTKKKKRSKGHKSHLDILKKDTSANSLQMGYKVTPKLNKTPISTRITNKGNNKKKNLTPIQKVIKFNKEKLESTLNAHATNKSRNSLSAFLTEL